MNTFTFVFGLLPWWSWLVLVAGIGLCFLPGVFPVVLGLVKLVPRDVWIVLGLGLAAVMWIRGHDELLVQSTTEHVTAERDKYWRGREDASNKAAAAREAALQLRLDTALAFAEDAATKHAQELAAQDAAHAKRFTELAQRRNADVTQAARDLCHLTRGVVRHFNAGAASANGDALPVGESAAGPGADAASAPSEVALDTYVDAVRGTQDALGSCRDQVVGWQTYYSGVLAPWIASTVQSLQSCVP